MHSDFLRPRVRLIAIHASLSLFAFATFAVERTSHKDGGTILAQQWEVIDIAFTADQIPEQPVDIEFDAAFRNENGVEQKAAGFFDGGQEFVVRFTPPSAGQWTYETTSSLPGLNGKSGSLTANWPHPGRKGGIVIDPKTPTRFHYESGQDYYCIAFEVDWLFALDADNPDDIPVTRKFVDQIVESGFNQIVMNVYAHDVTWPKDQKLAPEHEYGSPSTFPFGGTNDDPDHTKLNVDYFQRLDRVIDLLDQRGIAAHLMIYVWNKRVNWPAANSDEDNRCFDYVAKRYQAFPNLVWDISKEALGYGHNDVNYITDRIQRLRKLDHFDRLITVHDYSYCRRFTDQVDFVSVQLWQSELHSVMRKVVEDMPGKPILNIEHGGYERGPYVVFEGNYTSPEVCLERAYQCVFAGTYPTHYWQGAAWNVIIPDLESLAPADRPRLDYYRHMNEFAMRYQINRLSAGGKHSNAGFSLHDGANRYIYYVPKENISIGLRLPNSVRGGTMTGTWFNPFTGEYDEPISQTIPQWPAFRMPDGEGFRILIVDVIPPGKE